jgi:transmembrane sensor
MTDGTKDDSDRDRWTVEAHEAAIAWWVRRDAGPLSRQEAQAFDAWLAADEANAAAFAEICSLCGEVKALRPRAGAPARRWRRLVVAPALLAASLAAALVFPQTSLLLRSDVHTGVGETRSVALADGSQVQLGPKSAIAIHYESGRREVSLLEGEAYFEAAPDARRPFVVAAAGGTVTALGTAFDVALEERGARVTVTRHSVAVASAGQKTLVAEGRQSAFGPNAPTTAPVAVEIDDFTAWRRGKLIFVDRPLGEVVDVLARYRRGFVVIASAATRRLRVNGVFDAKDPAGALRAIEASLDLDALHIGDYLVVLR